MAPMDGAGGCGARVPDRAGREHRRRRLRAGWRLVANAPHTGRESRGGSRVRPLVRGGRVYFASMRGRPRPGDFGFRRPALKNAILGFILAGVGYYVVTAIYASVVKLHGSDKLPSELGVSKSTAALVAATVFVCVIAPMAEEFFFRGFIFGALRRWRVVVAGRNIGTWLAAIVTGILFGLAHTGSASSQYLVPLGFLGFVLCLLRWRTGSLYPCMALHSFNNSLALGVNQLHWNAAEILALVLGSALVIAAATIPLAGRARWSAG